MEARWTSDLMGATRLQPAGEQACGRLPDRADVTFKELPVGDGCAAVRARRHLLPRMGMASNRLVDGAAWTFRYPPDESEIAAAQGPCAAVVGELPRERAMGPIRLGNDKQPAGILVQPVHDARPLFASDAGEGGAAVRDQRVHQRARAIARGGMDHEPGRLVEDQELGILEHDFERNVFGGDRRLGGRRKIELDAAAGVDAKARIADRCAVDCDLA